MSTHEAAEPSTPTFDPYGVPVGADQEAMWQTIACGLLTTVEQADGWDAPNSLWAVLTPVASEALSPDAVARLRGYAAVDGRELTGPAYGIVRLLTYPDSGRASLAGLVAPEGTAALVCVNEAWATERGIAEAFTAVAGTGAFATPPAEADERTEAVLPMPMTAQEEADARRARGQLTSDERPSTSPDRVEVRQALVVRPDGVIRGYLHRRGMDLSTPDQLLVSGRPGSRLQLGGVIPDLLQRAFGTPQDPAVSVGEILGRATLTAVTHLLTATDSDAAVRLPEPAITRVVETLIASVIDSFDLPPDPGVQALTLHAIFTSFGPTAQQLPDWQVSSAAGPLYMAARRLAATSWDDLLAQAGARRWLDTADDGVELTPELWDWYGAGHLTRFLDEGLPGWGGAVEALTRAADGATTAHVLGILHAAGWTYTSGQPGRRR